MHVPTDIGCINRITFYFAGSFSRYEYARESKSRQPSVKALIQFFQQQHQIFIKGMKLRIFLPPILG